MKEKEILDSVRDKLKGTTGLAVYFDHVREGITSPCFFASLVDVASMSNLRLVYHDCTLHITYFAPKKAVNPMELYTIKDTVKDAFVSGLSVRAETEDGAEESRYIKFTSVSAEIGGQDADLIYFDLPFVYYEKAAEDDSGYTDYDPNTKKKRTYLMEEIHSNFTVKDDLKRMEE